MFSITYPSHSERQVYAQRAHRIAVPPLPAWCVRSPVWSPPPPVRAYLLGRGSFTPAA